MQKILTKSELDISKNLVAHIIQEMQWNSKGLEV